MPKILAFAGTTRTESFNKKLIRFAATLSEMSVIDLRDYPMPLYDGDLEAKEGIPPNGKKFKDLLKSHAGLLISTGEYNSSITGVLKNAIDWASRAEKGEKELECFRGKVAGLMSASPGALGGMRALVHVRAILGNIGVLVIPEQFALSRANEAFEADGSLKNPKQRASIERVVKALVHLVNKLT